MGFLERDHAAGLEGHDVHMRVVADVVGFDKAGGAPAFLGVGHPADRHIAFVGHESLRRRDAGGGFVKLAQPVEPGGGVAFGKEGPVGPGRDIGIGTCVHLMTGAVDGQGGEAFGEEQPVFRPGFRVWRVRAAARLDLHHILAEGFGKAGHRAGDQPKARAAPAGKIADHDVGKAALRDEGIGAGEDRALGHQGGLRGQAPGRGEIAGMRVGHGNWSLRRSSAMRST